MIGYILFFYFNFAFFVLLIFNNILSLQTMSFHFRSLIGLVLIIKCIYSFEILTASKQIEQKQIQFQSIIEQMPEQIIKDIINTTQRLWPLPKRFSANNSSQEVEFDINDISFKIQSLSGNVQAIVNHYILNVFKMNPQNQGSKLLRKGTPITLSIVVKNSKQILPQSTEHEKFQLTIRQNQKWELICDYFPGFVRGFQTFSQLLEKRSNGRYIIRNRPVLIDDQPDYRWRGLMIDTSRHYLPVSQITKIIDGLMYNKMNVLHWHIIDQDSFPMQVKTRPELSQFGNLAGVYSLEDLKYILQYASDRAVRVIPEYDSPAHTRSWGRSPQLANVTLDGELPFQGQFNPIVNLTYEVLTDVIKYVNSVFSDRYVHLGGDQVNPDVWDEHPEIKQWMKANNISNYDELQVYYRKKQRQILRSVNSSKKAIYWANQQINLPVDQEDVIQWWGDTENLDQIKTRKSQIILSNYDLAYLDVGFGDQLGDPYQTHISWRDMYAFKGKIQGVNIIGGQACMWSELTYKGNIQQKLWIRSSIIAERLWNEQIDIKADLLNIVKRLIEQRKRMQERGYKCSPVTVGLCQKDPSICFN